MTTDKLLFSLLKSHFGYKEFRPLQKEIVTNVLSGRDSLVLMPTGGGKSLCYQLSALCFDGITLVVSPLVSLMKDQVDALKANGIWAEFISSALGQPEIALVQARAKNGQIKLLYIAPERLGLPGFRDFIRSLNIKLIAIDEAHCISEWGHEFRPDYRNLRMLRQDFPTVPMIALTATATERVREDIVDQLDLHHGNRFLTSFNRPNLNYYVRPKKNTFTSLVSLLQKHKNEATIIYCLSRNDTERLADELSKQSLLALPYHAGLSNSTRSVHQEKFARDQVSIIVATIAFGMGIDKPDVRLVVHYNLPKSLEGYYQETGRAGRDGLPSECVLYYSYGDKTKQDYFIRQMTNKLERSNAEQKLAQMVEFCQLQSCRRRFLLEYFGERGEEEACDGCDFCLSSKEDFDATEIAQKILSAVIRTGERFGMGHISDVLRGSKSKRVLDLRHDALSVYGIASSFSNSELKLIINLLLAKGLLGKSGNEYPTLEVTGPGRNFLKQGETLILEKLIQLDEAVSTSANLDYHPLLFGRLRTLRSRLANERGVPPFVIFGDVTLQQMATYFPQGRESLSQVSGVGAAKLEQFGEEFLSIICLYAQENGLTERSIPSRRRERSSGPARHVGSTYQETNKLLTQKLGLDEIAARRGLALSTVVNHVERLVSSGEQVELEHLMPSPDRFLKIQTAFRTSGTEYLTPVKESLGADYSYEELKLVRLHLRQN